MANFEKSIKLLEFLEFSNNDEYILHKNDNEEGLTFYGIYEKYSKDWKAWSTIKRYLEIEPNIKKCSKILAGNKELKNFAYQKIKSDHWNIMQLDKVKSQTIADNLFIFGFHTSPKISTEKTQKILNIKVDGIFGQITLKALNSANEDDFKKEFDKEELSFYAKLVEKKPQLKKYENGWYNRALFAYSEKNKDFRMS